MKEMLKELRIRANLTQADLAENLGYTTPQFVSNWERGKSLPPPKDFKPLARALGVSSEIFVLEMLKRYELRLRDLVNGTDKNGRNPKITRKVMRVRKARR